MTSVLRARGVQIPGRLQRTDIELSAGEVVGVIGPNGGGKTSLIRALADVEGSADLLEIAGEPLKSAPSARRPYLLGFLPASREIVWPISVEHIVGLGLPTPDEQRAAEMLELFGLQSLRRRPIGSISTGERSRTLLARALVAAPKLLLLDEPLSNMDPYWALRTVEIVTEAVRARGAAAMIVLHDLQQAEAFDRLLLIDEGRLMMSGAPADVLDSAILQESYGIERKSGRWAIRRQADPQSSP
jgi:iron complex transport system ATP-binding protein